MDPTQPPLNVTPQVTGTSPYAAPNNPYQSPAMASVIAALKGGAQGVTNQPQQQGGAVSAQPGVNNPASPNYNQFGQGIGTGLGNLLTALGGSSPAYGGGNLLSGDAYGGNAAVPLPGLDASDYG